MAHENKKMISFFITDQCNLDCKYCVNDAKNIKNPNSINVDFAKRGLEDFFFKRTDLFGEGNNRIRFYATGEPTTRIDLVKEITEHAKELKGNDLFVELQTNGYFSKEKADWINQNVDEVWVSIDGPKEIQNKNRPTRGGKGTSERVQKNIEYLISNGTFVGVRPTISPEDVGRQKEIIDYFDSLGIKWIYAEPMFESVEQQGNAGNSIPTLVNLDKFKESFVDAFRYAKEKGIHYGNFFTMNFDEKCKTGCRSCKPMPHLTTDGYVSGCDLAYSGKTQLPSFIFGKYNQFDDSIHYFPKKMDTIRKRNIDEVTECKSCEVKENCGGGCAGLAYHITGDLMGTVPEFCDTIKYLAKEIPRNTGRLKRFHP